MARQFTRRQVAVALASSAALTAQAPNPPLPQNAEQELTAARDFIRQNIAQLAQFPLPMATEPATHFKA